MPKPYELTQVVDHGSDEEIDPREAGCGTAYLLVAYSIFGGWNVVARYAVVEGSNPLVLVTARGGLASVLLFLYVYFLEKPDLRRALLATKDLALLGGLTCAVQSSYILGTAWTSAQTAAVMQALAPVVGCWMPVLCGQESVNMVRIFSASLAGGSVCIMCLGTHSAVSNERYIMGVLILCLEQVWLVMSAVLSKNLLSQFSPVALTAYSSAWGTGFSMLELWVVRFSVDASLNFSSLCTRSMAVSLIYSTILVSCVGYSLRTVSIKNTNE